MINSAGLLGVVIELQMDGNNDGPEYTYPHHFILLPVRLNREGGSALGGLTVVPKQISCWLSNPTIGREYELAGKSCFSEDSIGCRICRLRVLCSQEVKIDRAAASFRSISGVLAQ